MTLSQIDASRAWFFQQNWCHKSVCANRSLNCFIHGFLETVSSGMFWCPGFSIWAKSFSKWFHFGVSSTNKILSYFLFWFSGYHMIKPRMSICQTVIALSVNFDAARGAVCRPLGGCSFYSLWSSFLKLNWMSGFPSVSTWHKSLMNFFVFEICCTSGGRPCQWHNWSSCKMTGVQPL